MLHNLSIWEVFPLISPTTKQYKAATPQTIKRTKRISILSLEKVISREDAKVVMIFFPLNDEASLTHGYIKTNSFCGTRKSHANHPSFLR
jgi:hypothetical protein